MNKTIKELMYGAGTLVFIGGLVAGTGKLGTCMGKHSHPEEGIYERATRFANKPNQITIYVTNQGDVHGLDGRRVIMIDRNGDGLVDYVQDTLIRNGDYPLFPQEGRRVSFEKTLTGTITSTTDYFPDLYGDHKAEKMRPEEQRQYSTIYSSLISATSKRD